MMTNKECKGKCCCLKDFQKNQPERKNKNCGGSGDSKGCPCHQISYGSQLGTISTQFELCLTDNISAIKKGWHYSQKNLTPGFPFIWLKPKISALAFV